MYFPCDYTITVYVPLTLLFSALPTKLHDVSGQRVDDPLVAAQEDGAAGTDPHDAGADACEEWADAVSGVDVPEDGEDALALLAEHDARLEYVEWRRDGRGDGAAGGAVQGAFGGADVWHGHWRYYRRRRRRGGEG